MSVLTATQNQVPARLTAAQALTHAEPDAIRAYGDLTPYRVELRLEPDGWHVDYELKDPLEQGGGPHYVIDATTGAILSKKYYQ